MLPKTVLLALSAVLLAVPLNAASPETRKLEDVVYGQGSGRDLKLDLYLPATPSTAHGGTPVVLYFHGGGWRVGGKGEGKRYAELFTSNGIAFASVDYRLSGEAIWPAQIFDAKTAVRWARANARRYGFDSARVGVFGESAGGHLVALLGTTESIKALEDRRQGSPKASSRVQAVCDVSGPVDLNIPTTSVIGKLSVRGELGGSAAEKPDLVRQADPSLYVKGGEPPFLIIQGGADALVVTAHARKLEAALKAHDDSVTLDIVPGGKHVPMKGEKQRNEVLVFFKKHLG